MKANSTPLFDGENEAIEEQEDAMVSALIAKTKACITELYEGGLLDEYNPSEDDDIDPSDDLMTFDVAVSQLRTVFEMVFDLGLEVGRKEAEYRFEILNGKQHTTFDYSDLEMETSSTYDEYLVTNRESSSFDELDDEE